MTTRNAPALNPRQALSGALLRLKPTRQDVDRFAAAARDLFAGITPHEGEEFHKNLLSAFLKGTFYSPGYSINTKGRSDLVIHNGPTAASPVGVLLEVKSPQNTAEMPRVSNINVKGLQELLLYYLRERLSRRNLELRHAVVTNAVEWFVFDAAVFERAFAQDRQLTARFTDFEAGRLAGNTTEFFYREIARPAIDAKLPELEYTHFKLTPESLAGGAAQVVPYFKVLSPQHLLKLPFPNDSNTLDRDFYSELLHIMGLEESAKGKVRRIGRVKAASRNPGTLIESTLRELESLQRIVPARGDKRPWDEVAFPVALELVLTWVNRVLFLKLLEAQLLSYHRSAEEYRFLSPRAVSSYNDINELFFQVLARRPADRSTAARARFPDFIPYLNSSLFAPTDSEQRMVFISNLKSDAQIPTWRTTVLKTPTGERRTGSLGALDYLLSFLDAYDFASEAAEDVRDDQKSLISPSVLGLIFEKINGYKDGSYFTPGFVTMAMARATIRRAVVNRFNESKGWACENFESLYDKIGDRAEANRIVNSVRICDPAVGSGHFLVSALNELLAVKSDLRILQDGEGRRLKEYDLAVSNDELVVRDEDGNLVSYRPSNPESHRVQEALFREKRTIIESCLFGVDVNPNSVKICQLRLWIELLKHAFYKSDGELETLPNIDINIKVGNSLISRFPLDADLRPVLKKTKRTLTSYREAVSNYQNATSREAKADVEELIRQIKGDFRVEILSNDPKVRRRASLTEEIRSLRGQQSFGETQVTKAARKARLAKLEEDLAKLSAQIKAIEENRIFQAAFEWRFEFPEVLNENGDFEGFDAVIGNPPYISALALSKSADPAELRHYKAAYATSKGTVDLYVYFFELGVKLLRPGAYLSYISPNRYLSASYGTALRGFLLDETSLEVIGDYSNVKVFAEAATYPIVTMLRKKRNAHNLRAFTFVALDQPLRWRQIAAGDLRAVNDNILGFVLSDKFEVTKKLMLDSDSLATCGAINATSTAGEAERYHAFINQSGGFKLVNSGTIDKYCTSWGLKPLRDKRTEFLTPYLAREEEVLGANRLSLYSSPKIIFAKIGITPEAFYDEGGIYASINTNCIHSFTPEYDPFYVLGWVNSKLFQYMYECFFDGLKMSGGYLLYSAPNLSNMYIRRASDEDQRAIGVLARSIAAQLGTEPSRDVHPLQGELDRKFYEVFSLSVDEVTMVEEGVRRSGGTSDAEADTMDAVTAGDLEEET